MDALKTILSFIFIGLLGFAAAGCAKKSDAPIKITGSTTILPFMEKVRDHYAARGERAIELRSGGSMHGIEDLMAGKCDLAMCSSPISEKLAAESASKGVSLKGFFFAWDMVVPIVHPSNPVKTLTMEQLRGIFSGKIDSWSTVGGTDSPIHVVSRTPASGTGEVWKQVVLGSSRLKEESLFRDSNSGVLAYVAGHPEAIGYVGVSFLNHEVKPLSIDRIPPTADQARQGKYPLARRLYLYANEKDLSPALKSLLVFILSGNGQQIVEESGLIPRDSLPFTKASSSSLLEG